MIVIKYMETELHILFITELLIMPIIKNSCIYSIFPMVKFIMESVALSIFHDRFILAEVRKRDQLNSH